MNSFKKALVSIFLALALMVSPLSAFAINVTTGEISQQQEPPPDPGAMVLDLVVARPVGLVATLGGSVFFILSAPFSALGGNTDDAWQSLVVSPAEYTFKRPLGSFDE